MLTKNLLAFVLAGLCAACAGQQRSQSPAAPESSAPAAEPPSAETPPLDPEGSSGPAPAASADVGIWTEFVGRMRAGDLTKADVSPHPELAGFEGTIVGFLDKMRATAKWEEWERTPEVHRVGDNVHFVVSLTEGGTQPHTYVFTFYDSGDRWYVRHLEAITVRLDRVGSLPTSEFPDVDPATKIWMSEEKRVTERIRLFRHLLANEGRSAAFDWFKDGVGYRVAVKTWVPYVEPSRAFVLYLCWEQSKLRGDQVVLQQLDETRAVVRLTSTFLLLYERTGHLSKMVSREDYVALFESVWRDRAEQSGWTIAFEYGDPGTVTFRLQRSTHSVLQPWGRVLTRSDVTPPGVSR